MANEALQTQQVLVQLKTVASSAVPVPGDGPVLFADTEASDAGVGSVTIKLPSGASVVIGPESITVTPADGDPVSLGQPYMTDARVRGAVGDAVQVEATVEALGTAVTVASALSQDDVGKVISIAAAGDGADLITTITAVSGDGLTVTVADAATDGATDAVAFVGTSDVAALTAADETAGADGTMLIPPGVYLIDDDLALTAGTVRVMRGAMFVVLEGFTLSFTGYVEAAPDQVPLLLHADCLGALERTIPNTMTGTATPEAAVVGIIGDTFTDVAGGAGTTLYVKESGANTNTGWSTTA